MDYSNTEIGWNCGKMDTWHLSLPFNYDMAYYDITLSVDDCNIVIPNWKMISLCKYIGFCYTKMLENVEITWFISSSCLIFDVHWAMQFRIVYSYFVRVAVVEETVIAGSIVQTNLSGTSTLDVKKKWSFKTSGHSRKVQFAQNPMVDNIFHK